MVVVEISCQFLHLLRRYGRTGIPVAVVDPSKK